MIKNFRIISRLEVKSDYVVKGMRMEGLRKISTPEKLASTYYENKFDEIFYDDIVASLYNRPININLVKSVSNKISIPLTAAGRVAKIKDFYNLFHNGTDKVSLNSAAVFNPKIINDAAKIFGSQSIVCHIQYKNLIDDEKNPEIFYENGRSRAYIKLFEWINRIQSEGAGEIYLFSIDNDGIDYPIDFHILEKARDISKVPIIYGGGVNSLNIIEKMISIGFDGVTISAAAHFKKLNIINIKKNLAKKYKNINFNL